MDLGECIKKLTSSQNLDSMEENVTRWDVCTVVISMLCQPIKKNSGGFEVNFGEGHGLN